MWKCGNVEVHAHQIDHRSGSVGGSFSVGEWEYQMDQYLKLFQADNILYKVLVIKGIATSFL
jgi:hypothetical protein